MVASTKAPLKCKRHPALNTRFMTSVLCKLVTLLHKVSVFHVVESLLAARFEPEWPRHLPGRSKAALLDCRTCRAAVTPYRTVLTTMASSSEPARLQPLAQAGYQLSGKTAWFRSFRCRLAKRWGTRTQ